MKHDPNKCPKCGKTDSFSALRSMRQLNLNSDILFIEWKCQTCGLQGAARFNVEFVQHLPIWEKDEPIFDISTED